MAVNFGPVSGGYTSSSWGTTTPVVWNTTSTQPSVTWSYPTSTTIPITTTTTTTTSIPIAPVEEEVEAPPAEHVHEWEPLSLSAREDPVADVCRECGEFAYR